MRSLFFLIVSLSMLKYLSRTNCSTKKRRSVAQSLVVCISNGILFCLIHHIYVKSRNCTQQATQLSHSVVMLTFLAQRDL